MTENKKETPATTEVESKVKPCDLKIKITRSDPYRATRMVKHMINDIEPLNVSEVKIIID